MIEKRVQRVGSVIKSHKIMRSFDAHHLNQRAVEVVKRVDLDKITVHRYLKTLQHIGLLDFDPKTGEYRIGLVAFELGTLYLLNTNLRKASQLWMEKLVEKCNETVHLSILDKGEIVYIEKIDSTRSVGMKSNIGQRLPSYSTSSGKVLLAHLPERERQEVVSGLKLEKWTENTITDKKKLLKGLEEVRRQGFAIDNEEDEPGIKCIGAPVWDSSGRVVASISISGPSFRMTPLSTKKSELLPILLETCHGISKALGYTESEVRKDSR